MTAVRVRTRGMFLICLTMAIGCNQSNNADVATEKALADAELNKAKAEATNSKDAISPSAAEPANQKTAQPQELPVGESRKAAEWVINIGGIVKVLAEGKPAEIHGPDGVLPNGSLEITEIKLPGGDKVTNETIKVISGLQSVVLLNATDNKLSDFTFLKGMSNLRHFNGHGTDLDDACLGYLKNCPKLESLDLGTSFQNHVTDDGIQSLKDMKDLAYLDILGTRASDVGLGNLSGLRNLTYLAMGNHGVKVEISDAGLANLASLQKLQALIIVNCAGITDAGLDHIKKMSNLKRLELSHTQVTDAGFASLKAALPNCEINRAN